MQHFEGGDPATPFSGLCSFFLFLRNHTTLARSSQVLCWHLSWPNPGLVRSWRPDRHPSWCSATASVCKHSVPDSASRENERKVGRGQFSFFCSAARASDFYLRISCPLFLASPCPRTPRRMVLFVPREQATRYVRSRRTVHACRKICNIYLPVLMPGIFQGTYLCALVLAYSRTRNCVRWFSRILEHVIIHSSSARTPE